jgi:hypothetical protein
MPIMELQKLSQGSDDAQSKAALSACIATEVKNGHPQDQATAMCYSQVEKAIGRTLGGKKAGTS